MAGGGEYLITTSVRKTIREMAQREPYQLVIVTGVSGPLHNTPLKYGEKLWFDLVNRVRGGTHPEELI